MSYSRERHVTIEAHPGEFFAIDRVCQVDSFSSGREFFLCRIKLRFPPSLRMGVLVYICAFTKFAIYYSVLTSLIPPSLSPLHILLYSAPPIQQTGGSAEPREDDDGDAESASPSRRAPTAAAPTHKGSNEAPREDDRAEWLKMRHTGEHRKARPTRNSASWIKETATSPTSPTERPVPRALHESRPSGAPTGFEPEAREDDSRSN